MEELYTELLTHNYLGTMLDPYFWREDVKDYEKATRLEYIGRKAEREGYGDVATMLYVKAIQYYEKAGWFGSALQLRRKILGHKNKRVKG